MGCVFLLTVATRPVAVYAQTYTDMHDFNGATDGANPYFPGLIAQARDGDLYGTLSTGGTNGFGTVYKITTSGAFQVIYSFTGGNDGAHPYGGLVLSTDGNLYGTTHDGGANSQGTIFRITTRGTLTTLHSFIGTDGCQPQGPPIARIGSILYGVTACQTTYTITSSGHFKLLPGKLDGPSYAPLLLANDGNFYGTTNDGGNQFRGSVFKLTPSGAVETIYSFDVIHGASPFGPLVQGSDGNLYGTTEGGGAAQNAWGTIFKMTLKGSITVLKNFDLDSADGGTPFAGLVAGSDSNFYGITDQSNGAPNGTIFKITKNGTFSVLHTFDQTDGALGYSTPMQHTNGMVYGTTFEGGQDNFGAFWSLSNSLSPFCSIVGFPRGKSGTTVEILGQGFTTASNVIFGSGSATFKVVNDTFLTAVVPDAGTTGAVTVTTSSGPLASKQTYRVLPVVTSFQPPSGPVGTKVTIKGSGFIGTTIVMFNGTKASFTVHSATKITATVPGGATTGKIKVTTPGGTATSATDFTVTL
jgi:uncharacterized repeat protein (TIGR03803 family)